MLLLISVSSTLCGYTVTQTVCVCSNARSHHITSVDAAAVASLRHIAEATEHRPTLYILLIRTRSIGNSEYILCIAMMYTTRALEKTRLIKHLFIAFETKISVA